MYINIYYISLYFVLALSCNIKVKSFCDNKNINQCCRDNSYYDNRLGIYSLCCKEPNSYNCD